MRVKCQLEVVNHSVASQGMRGGCGKAAQATLFLARKPGDIIFLMYCTTKNKQGVKYKVLNNVQQMFTKCISEGKATIRLKDPTVDLCVKKANPVDLKRILNALKMAHKGENISGQLVLSSMAPASTKQVEKVKTKMIITAQKDYPVTSSFPSSLERLSVNTCNLARVDGRVMKLKHLTALNLSNNKIKNLPEQLAHMPMLCELDVSHNVISDFQMELCNANLPLCKQLKNLNLSHNNIQQLPDCFSELSELWSLNISHNQIKILPRQMGKLKKLAKLNASHNQLKFLPFSITFLSLENLDLYMNPFTDQFAPPNLPERRLIFNSPLSLLEISARNIRQNNTFYDNYEYVPYILIKYLDNGKQCQCSSFCFSSFVQFFTYYNLRSITQSLVGLDTGGGTTAPVCAVICSNDCLNKYVPQALY
ncbi:leucine-rich repeat protein 1-like [Ciona intestinalis]